MSNKILSQAPTELELQFAKAFVDLENSSPELKAELRPLQFKSVREVCLFLTKREKWIISKEITIMKFFFLIFVIRQYKEPFLQQSRRNYDCKAKKKKRMAIKNYLT